MHILFATPSYNHCFEPLSSIFFEDQVNAVATGLNHKVGVISVNMISLKSLFRGRKTISFHSDNSDNRIQSMTIYTFAIPKMKKVNHLVHFSLMKRLFKQYVKKCGLPEIIHVQQFDAGEIAVWAKNNFNTPFIVTEHSSIFSRNLANPWEYRCAGKIYDKSAVNIAVSKTFSEFLSDRFKAKFDYLPNIVDTDFFEPVRKKENSGNVFVFINVANLDDNKNHILLLKSFKNAFKDNAGYRLIIVGDGYNRTKLEGMIRDFGLISQVKLIGKASRSQIRDLLQASDRFVLSSKYETFGIVLIEAMSCGLPVISTRCTGPESIITDERLGILCDINPDSVTKALLDSSQKRYNYSFIRNHCISNFSKEVIGKALNEIYKKVIAC